jgi:S-adenosylmethionine:tRNA ribosyltransferase-isomerase
LNSFRADEALAEDRKAGPSEESGTRSLDSCASSNMSIMTKTSHYDYSLPRELIAQFPLPNRGDARLMVVSRRTGRIEHRRIRDLPEILSRGDCLVLNDSRVIPARLMGRRERTGGRWEGLVLAIDPGGVWRLLARTRGKIKPGELVSLMDPEGRESARLRLLLREPEGTWLAEPVPAEDWQTVLDRVGRTPLPCYIRHGVAAPGDATRYQTVYARAPGSAAAPTAGLHFTTELLERLRQSGVRQCMVTLHVGLDTFRPIQTAMIEEHRMHAEWCQLDGEAAQAINQTRAAGCRVVAVGTTSVRVLETAAEAGGVRPWVGETRLFIHGDYRFRAVDALLTNFHLPRSTLLVLVSCFGGEELIRRAYAEAIRERYRFYSYGDAMLIL